MIFIISVSDYYLEVLSEIRKLRERVAVFLSDTSIH